MFEELRSGVILVIGTRVDRLSNRYDERLLGWLNGEEKNRLARFRFAHDRRSFLLAHGLLHWALARCLNQHPSEVFILRERYGKPYLPQAGGPAFSLSHTADAVLCAIGYVERMGADIEPVQHVMPIHELAKNYCTALERGVLSRLSPDTAVQTFLRWWTVKEAYIKADGRGLSIHPAAICCMQSIARETSPLGLVRELHSASAATTCQGNVVRAWDSHWLTWIAFAKQASLQPIYLQWLGGDETLPLQISDQWQFSGVTELRRVNVNG
jgi:phosphopantetheinyl transferase